MYDSHTLCRTFKHVPFLETAHISKITVHFLVLTGIQRYEHGDRCNCANSTLLAGNTSVADEESLACSPDC